MLVDYDTETVLLTLSPSLLPTEKAIGRFIRQAESSTLLGSQVTHSGASTDLHSVSIDVSKGADTCSSVGCFFAVEETTGGDTKSLLTDIAFQAGFMNEFIDGYPHVLAASGHLVTVYKIVGAKYKPTECFEGFAAENWRSLSRIPCDPH